MSVRLHLLMCVHCRRFASQLRKIRGVYCWIVEKKSDTPEAADLEERLVGRLVDSRSKPSDG